MAAVDVANELFFSNQKPPAIANATNGKINLVFMAQGLVVAAGAAQQLAPQGAADPLSVSEKAGASFMPQSGQSPGAATFTDGCIGQV